MSSAVKRKNTDKVPVQSLDYLIRQRKIWLNPVYQRGAVWTKSQKQLLIDSLLNEIDVPKLYFREISKGKYEYEVVDGQQRLRTINEFLSNAFEMPDESDAVDGHQVAGKDFQSLHTHLQMKLHNQPLDVVKLNEAYTDRDVEDMFLRLQNGTPLNAPEKRRAYPGNMRVVVARLSQDSVFRLCAFGNDRFGHEDAVAKVLHLLLTGTLTDIKPASIKKTYSNNRDITESHSKVKKLKKAFRFLRKSFRKPPSPKLKKYSFISLAYLVVEMMDKYNLSDFPSGFGKCFLEFEQRRVENEELPEEKQDPALAGYSDAARADSVADLKYRHELLEKQFLLCIPELAIKDPDRGFSRGQRLAVFIRDRGNCQSCGKKCQESDFHVDHIKAHSKGGETKLSNARLLCPTCNLKKGRRET
ncbi:MAG TPA: DUF262 domain-containing protein [Verrucomicrobiae bacterium]|nr:DUF262 domain-containing protein [Verrucomicrobiae bacterium]